MKYPKRGSAKEAKYIARKKKRESYKQVFNSFFAESLDILKNLSIRKTK